MPLRNMDQKGKQMHLHEVEDATDILPEYTIEGTPYTIAHVAYMGVFAILRDGRMCRAETKELRERFGAEPRSADTCRRVSKWLQGVWAKRVELALATGTAEEVSELQPLLKWLSQPGRVVTIDTLAPGVTVCFSGRNGDNSRSFCGKDLAEALKLMWEAVK